MRCWINKISNERNKVLIAKSPWNLNLLFLRQTCCWIIYYSVKHKMNYQPAYQQTSQIGTILPFWSHPHCSMENSSSYTTWSGVPRGIVVNPILIPVYISEWIKHSNIIYIYIYIYVWKLNQTVLELDFRAVKFLFFPRRDLNPHHYYTAAPFA